MDRPLSSRSRPALWSTWLERAHPLRFEVGDARLHGWTVGDGPTVLLVHGWGDRAASLGALIDPLTSSGFRVVGVDLPGHGASPPGATDLYSLAAAVRTVAEQVTPRAVVAHSMGGAVTLLAVRDGMRLDAADLDLPALVVHDLEDRHVGHADALLLVEAWASATLLTTEGLGHTRVLRDPEVTGRIADFLAAHLSVHSPDAVRVLDR